MSDAKNSALEQTRRLLEAQHRETSGEENVWRALAFEAREMPIVLPIGDVLELAVFENITPIPLTQPWLRGLTNLRGQLYAVIDLSVFLGGAETRLSRDARIILLADQGLNTCLLVNNVIGLKLLAVDQPLKSENNIPDEIQTYFKGEIEADDQFWAVLKVDALIKDPLYTQPSRVPTRREPALRV